MATEKKIAPSPLKAIRAKCIECCGGQLMEVKLCHLEDCALHPYRFGHLPKEQTKNMGKNWRENLKPINSTAEDADSENPSDESGLFY